MASEAKMEHNRALLRGDMEQAKTCVEQLAAVDEPEAQYRYAITAMISHVFISFCVV